MSEEERFNEAARARHLSWSIMQADFSHGYQITISGGGFVTTIEAPTQTEMFRRAVLVLGGSNVFDVSLADALENGG